MSGDEKDDHEEEKLKIRAELADMSFEELKKLKERLGAKVYNEAVFGVETKKRNRKTVFKRDNKNRPREMSSKKPVPLITQPVSVEESSASRDPRFDSLCGTYNPKGFKRSYGFLTEIREKELVELKKELKNTNDPEREGQIKYLIQRMENQNREEMRNKEMLMKKKEEYRERVEAMKEGKQPKFIKKSDKKLINLVEQYEDLKGSGKLEKHIFKHRKRNAQKARKNMNSM